MNKAKPLFKVSENLTNNLTDERKKYIWAEDWDNHTKEIFDVFYAFYWNNATNWSGFVAEHTEDPDAIVLGKKVYKNLVGGADEVVVYSYLPRKSEWYSLDSILEFEAEFDFLNNKEIVIYGAGDWGCKVLSCMKDWFETIWLVDSDEIKWGSKINGIEIHSPEVLAKLDMPVVIEAADHYESIDKAVLKINPHAVRFFANLFPEFLCSGIKVNEIGQNLILTASNALWLEHKDVFLLGDYEQYEPFIRLLKFIGIKIRGILTIEKEKCGTYESGIPYVFIYDMIYLENFYALVDLVQFSKYSKFMNSLGFEYGVHYEKIWPYSPDLNGIRSGILDMNLGISFQDESCMYPGFQVYGTNDGKKFKIVTLGGSTTDGSAYVFPSWPQYLFNKLGSNAVIYNGGVWTYKSTQELLKLIRDVFPLHPDLVIIYDGFNDANQCTDKNFEISSLKNICRSGIEHSEKWEKVWINGTRQTYFSGVETGGIHSYLKNIDLMKYFAEWAGINLVVFAQPFLFTKTIRNGSEQGMKYSECWRKIIWSDENLKSLENYQKNIRYAVESRDYMVDLTELFDDAEDVYLDICHVNEKGNKIIADRIYDELQKRNLLCEEKAV